MRLLGNDVEYDLRSVPVRVGDEHEVRGFLNQLGVGKLPCLSSGETHDRVKKGKGKGKIRGE